MFLSYIIAMQDLPVSSCWDRGRQYLSSSLNSLREKTSQISLPRQPLKIGALFLTLLLSNAKNAQAQNCFPPIPTQYAPLNQTFNVSFGNYLGPLTIREKGQAGLPSWLRVTNGSNMVMIACGQNLNFDNFYSFLDVKNSQVSTNAENFIDSCGSLSEDASKICYVGNSDVPLGTSSVYIKCIDDLKKPKPYIVPLDFPSSLRSPSGSNSLRYISVIMKKNILYALLEVTSNTLQYPYYFVRVVDTNGNIVLNNINITRSGYSYNNGSSGNMALSDNNLMYYYLVKTSDSSTNDLYGYDVNNPAAPIPLNCYAPLYAMTQIFIENSILYVGSSNVTQGRGISIIDINNPNMPIFLSSINRQINGLAINDLGGFLVSNQKIYIMQSSILSIVDISNLRSPVMMVAGVKNYDGPLLVSGTDLFVLTTQYAIRKFDVGDLPNLIPTDLIPTTQIRYPYLLAASKPTSYTIGLRGTPTTGNGTTTTIEIIGNGCRNEFNLTIGNPPLEAPKPITSTLPTSTNIPTGNDKEEFIYNLAGVFSSPSPLKLNYSIAYNNGDPLQPWMQLRTDPPGPRIEGQYNGSNAGNYYVLITATDPNGLTGSAVLPIIIQGPPYFNGTVPNLYPAKQQNFVYILSGIVKDPNNDPLTFRFDNLPNWLKFNTDLKTFSGDVPFDAANATVTMYVTDGVFPSVNAVFNITPGSAPVLNYPIPDQVGRINKYFETHFPANSFTHPERLPLTYSAEDLPSFLSFFIDGNGMGQFNGTSPNPFKDIVTFMAQDPYNRTKMVSFLLNIKDNEAPQVIGSMPPIPPAKTGAKSRWEFNIKKIFRDSTEDPLEVSWILSNGNPLPPCFLIKPTGIADIFEIIATPSTMDLGGIANTNKIYEIILSVRDDLGASASTNIRIEVTGKSLLQTVASIGGPIISALSLGLKLYLSQGKIINYINKMRHAIPTSEVVIDLNTDNHSWPLKTPASEIESIEILKESGKPTRFPWQSSTKSLGPQFSQWLSHHTRNNTLSITDLEAIPSDTDQFVIHVKGAKGVVAETFVLRIIPKNQIESSIVSNIDEVSTIIDMYADNSASEASYPSEDLSFFSTTSQASIA